MHMWRYGSIVGYQSGGDCVSAVGAGVSFLTLSPAATEARSHQCPSHGSARTVLHSCRW